jgi:hypothetical protein
VWSRQRHARPRSLIYAGNCASVLRGAQQRERCSLAESLTHTFAGDLVCLVFDVWLCLVIYLPFVFACAGHFTLEGASFHTWEGFIGFH